MIDGGAPATATSQPSQLHSSKREEFLQGRRQSAQQTKSNQYIGKVAKLQRITRHVRANESNVVIGRTGNASGEGPPP